MSKFPFLTPSPCQRILEYVTLGGALVALVVWPLSGAIAARNLALVIGCLASVAWMLHQRSLITLRSMLPAILLLVVPAWLWAHYFFLPTDVATQLYDLQGTWMRVIFAVILAAGLGHMIAARPGYLKPIEVVFMGMALVTLAWYLCLMIYDHRLLIDNFKAFFKYKSALVYFLAWPCLWAFANATNHLLFADSEGVRNKPKKQVMLITGMAMIVICIIDFIAAHALNGVLMAAVAALVLVISYGIFLARVSCIKKLNQRLMLIAIILTLGALFFTFWQYDQKYEQKLSHLLGDIQVASKIDENVSWRRESGDLGPRNPADETGRVINESTYERVSWFLKGQHILRAHPLGTGFTTLPFGYYMTQEYPQSTAHKTHSGWLDLTLGIGLPGILLIWAAIALGIKSAYKKIKETHQGQVALVALWLLGGMGFLWFPTELSEREFIESLFFMIAMLSTMVGPRLLPGAGKSAGTELQSKTEASESSKSASSH